MAGSPVRARCREAPGPAEAFEACVAMRVVREDVDDIPAAPGKPRSLLVGMGRVGDAGDIDEPLRRAHRDPARATGNRDHLLHLVFREVDDADVVPPAPRRDRPVETTVRRQRGTAREVADIHELRRGVESVQPSVRRDARVGTDHTGVNCRRRRRAPANDHRRHRDDPEPPRSHGSISYSGEQCAGNPRLHLFTSSCQVGNQRSPLGETATAFYAFTVACSNCGVENPPGARFCGGCGTPLARACPACGEANDAAMRFCNHCGAALDEPATPREAQPAAIQSVAERRLVSVLFADLVGFTSASEKRDAEETRELLSRYFDTCRRLIELYGGTVEKFIGDAVMAVWGTPVATEDDAERAVRAALDLVAAVSSLGDEVGAPELAARAGVLTGEAAVTLGAEGQGMVAGDLVNTAARIQSAAETGTVLVGDATKRTSEASIAYASAGTHELKGKDEPVPLWRALRVTAGRGGALKSAGLEPPFVGRDRELRLVKELFHATADEQRAHLVSVIGIAGIGKSRLGWEFFKYMDGLEEGVWWHRGRCLSYGEGVTYWALADMVRMRARIAEDEEAGSALRKLADVVEEHISDPEERRFVEPRLRHL